MMNRKRLIFWGGFLGGAGLLAVLPELMDWPAETPRAGELQAARIAPLAELRAAPAPAPRGPAAVPADSGATVAAPQEPAAPPPLAAASAMPPELFAVKSWQRPPPPAPPAPPPPPPARAPPAAAPTAPALPFQFMGRLDDMTRVRVFLQRGERVYAVAAGDVIDGLYRVERIDEGQLTLTYMPLNIPQTLLIGRS